MIELMVKGDILKNKIRHLFKKLEFSYKYINFDREYIKFFLFNLKVNSLYDLNIYFIGVKRFILSSVILLFYFVLKMFVFINNFKEKIYAIKSNY